MPAFSTTTHRDFNHRLLDNSENGYSPRVGKHHGIFQMHSVRQDGLALRRFRGTKTGLLVFWTHNLCWICKLLALSEI